MQSIAFVGTREIAQVDPKIVKLFHQAATMAARAGYEVRSGAAIGFDQLACEAAAAAGGKVHLSLPWYNYERDWWQGLRSRYPRQIEIEVYNPTKHPDWTRSVSTYHPSEGKLAQGAFALHARNFGILKPVITVVAVPNLHKLGGGGTGQALRIAAALRRRTYNLIIPEQFEELENRLLRALNKHGD